MQFKDAHSKENIIWDSEEGDYKSKASGISKIAKTKQILSDNPELRKASSKPELDDIILGFKPAQLPAEEIYKSWGYAGFDVPTPSRDLKIMSPKDYAEFSDWMKNIFVHTHKGTILAPNSNLYKAFMQQFKVYTAYSSNLGTTDEKTETAYNKLKQIYAKMSIGIKGHHAAGLYKTNE